MSLRSGIALAGATVALAATSFVAAQPASAVATNLECMTYSFDHYDIYCDLYKSGKSDYVSTSWEVNGTPYASNVNFVTIGCSSGVYLISASWTDSAGHSAAELTKAVCGA